MKRALAALAIVAGLGSCGQSPSADSYTFERKEFERPRVDVTIVVHASTTELRQAAERAGVRVEQGRELMAFAIIGRTQSTCELHLVDPARSYQPEWIGHEFAHCAFGRWHP